MKEATKLLGGISKRFARCPYIKRTIQSCSKRSCPDYYSSSNSSSLEDSYTTSSEIKLPKGKKYKKQKSGKQKRIKEKFKKEKIKAEKCKKEKLKKGKFKKEKSIEEEVEEEVEDEDSSNEESIKEIQKKAKSCKRKPKYEDSTERSDSEEECPPPKTGLVFSVKILFVYITIL